MKCFGKSAHGSSPQMGDNAIERMLEVMHMIKAANFQNKICAISGGESINKVPDSSLVEFFISSSSFEDFKRFFREKLAQEQVQVEFGGLGDTGKGFLPDNIMDSIDAIQACLGKIKSTTFALKNSDFNPPTSTTNLSKIMQRQGFLELFFDVCLLPDTGSTHSLDEFDRQFKAELAKTNTQFPNLILNLSRKIANPALNVSEDNQLVVAAKEIQARIGLEQKLSKKSNNSEAAQFHAAGMDAIAFGPGGIQGNSHSPNEFNLVDHLDHSVHFYDRMIERFCL
jgi:acetylornithine deacetylase/succinyl-diaminopimelate desuccinylase-like protein